MKFQVYDGKVLRDQYLAWLSIHESGKEANVIRNIVVTIKTKNAFFFWKRTSSTMS